jgi:predicted metal-dependent enzyme (double-stranded beta helix superfamily)
MAAEINGRPSMRGWLDETLIAASPTTLADLEEIVTNVGRSPWVWGHAVSFDVERRSHRVLYKTPHLEIALFGWAAGQDTTFHDHGGASGAAYICSGTLIEDIVEAVDGQVVHQLRHLRRADSAFSFGPDYMHRVRHDPAHGVALSIHAYTPAVSEATDYEIWPDGSLRAIDPVREIQPGTWREPIPTAVPRRIAAAPSVRPEGTRLGAPQPVRSVRLRASTAGGDARSPRQGSRLARVWPPGRKPGRR